MNNGCALVRKQKAKLKDNEIGVHSEHKLHPRMDGLKRLID